MMPSVDLSAAIIREPLTVPLKTPLLEAIALMDRNFPPDPNLEDTPSCILVVDQQQAVGILTERDVVRLTLQQRPLGEMTVAQAMSRPLISLPETAFVDVAAVTRLFTQHRIRHMPLVDGQGKLAGLVTRDSLRQVVLTQKLQRSQRQAYLVAEMALRIRQHTQLETLTTAIVEEVQRFLQADRVVVYQFQPDMSGVIVAESVVPPWMPCLAVQISDTCFQDNLGGAYQQGRMAAIADIYGADLVPCYLELLEKFQVRANLVVPILLPQAEEHPLWGLLIAHQCSGPRVWEEQDIYLLQQLSVQLAIALQQADLYQSLKRLNTSLETQVAKRTRTLQTLADRERLQANLATQIRASLDLETILDTATREIRATLQCDRVNIWRFGANWQPFVVAESTDSSLSLIGEWVSDTCLQDYVEIYRQGRVRVIPDIHTADLSDCHREMLVRLQVRAKVLVPLFCGEQLWGLLNVSESSQARDWQPEEIELLKALSLQLAIAIQQATTHGQLQAELNKRQQTELRLRKQEAKSRALLTAIPDYLFRVGADGEYRELINRNRDIRLLPVDLNPVGSTLAEVLPADLAARHQHYLQQAIHTGELQVYEQCVPVGDDLLCDEVRVVKSGEDEALFMIRDISDRKRAIAALTASEQRFRQLFEATPQIVVQGYDRYRRVIYWNPASEQLYGYSSAEAIGQKLEDLIIPSEMRAGVVTAFDDWMPGSAPIPPSELTLMDKQGNTVEVFSSQVVLDNSAGEPELYCVDIEIGAVKRTEAILQNLISGTATTGQDFFPALVSHIADALGVAYAIVTERMGEQLQTLALWANGALQPNFAYLAAPTPCGQALQAGSLYCARSVQQQFPDCPELIEMGAESYLGIALQDAQGEAIGNLCIYHQRPISDPQQAEQILRVFAARATAELERQRAKIALEKLNQTLEAKVIERTAALEEREARYCALVNVIPDLLIRIDAEGNYLDVIAGGGVELFNREQIQPGVNIYDVTPFDHAHERMGYVHQALQTREVQCYDYDLSIDGRQISETARIVAINDTEALIIVQDISVRARLEAKVAERAAALRASEAQFRAMIRAVPDLLLRVTAEGGCLACFQPQQSEQFLPVQQHLAEILPPELLQRQLDEIAQAIASGQVQVYEHQFQKGDAITYEEVRISPLSSDEVLIMVRDITQEQQSAAALQESRQFIQTVLDTLPLAIFWKDRNSIFLGGNRRSLEAVEVTSEQAFIGKTDFDFASTRENALNYRADDQEVMNSGKAKLAIEEVITTPDGAQIWIETHKAPLKNPAGDVIGIVGAFQDITQRKQAEAELKAKTKALQQSYQDLKEAQAQLIQSEKMSSLGQLVAGVAP
ncbi:MAG: GAF domain-containing protein [Leptolyngbyaceae cyanobacterium]